MAERLNLVRHAVSGTPGTGTVTLGAAITGFLTITQAGGQDGRFYEYAIESTLVSQAFTHREIGIGKWNSAAGTLERTYIRNSTNNNAAINVQSDAHVIITPLAEDDPIDSWQFAY